MVEIIDFESKKKTLVEKKKTDLTREADRIRLDISKHQDQINLLKQELKQVLEGNLPNDTA